jgi:streptogramin lyase
MSKLALLRRTSLAALVLGALGVFGAGVAGAAPVGQITEFGAPGTNPAQVVAGADGNLWFSDRNGAVGQITTGGTVVRFTSGLNPGSAVRSIATGADGNLWFSDPGTISAVGMINPSTRAISEFSLPASSMPLGIAAGPDGSVWFTDSGTTKAIGMINPTTHAISEFSSGLNPGSLPGAAIVGGPDGALWFMAGGIPPAIGRIDPTTHAISEFSAGLKPGANLGRVAVGPDGNLWFGDKGTTPSIYVMNPTTHAITSFTSGLNAGSLPGGIWSGADGNVWFTDQGAIRAIGRIGAAAPAAVVTPPSVTGSGGVNVPQSCDGDVWSSWAGQQPSHSAYGFDGYQWLLDGSPITGATGQSYTPTAADAGHRLSCKATVTYALLVVTAAATSTNVQVTGAAEELGDLADAVVGIGPGRSLAAKVAAIQEYVAADDTADACATLGDFLNEVNAQTGKKISSARAASLNLQAQDIDAALDC